MTGQTDIPDALGEFQREFRRDPGLHGTMIAVMAVLSILLLVGIAWLAIKPDGHLAGKVATALFLAALLLLAAYGIRHFWLALWQRFRLHERGLIYFDGRDSHSIPWSRVAEIRETICTVKLYGITASGPKPELELVTTDGVRCSIGTDVLDLESLSPVVAEEVNASLRGRAQQALRRRNPVRFGILSISNRGLVIEAPAPKTWWQELQDRFSTSVHPPVVQPCELSWEEVGGIHLAKTTRGDALADQTTYHRLEIRQKGTERPVLEYPVPEFANFQVFTEVLDALQHPLSKPAANRT